MKTFIKNLVFLGIVMPFAVNADPLLDIQHEWAKARYQTPENAQEKAFELLIEQAGDLVNDQPGSAAAKVWLAICLSTDAGVNGGMGALGKVKKAKTLLEEAERIDPDVLNGSVYTSLGSLYYQVPGWPIAFGNDKQADYYLQKALDINPTGIDPNYFYADFLIQQDKDAEAIPYLQKALAAPDRPNRPIADLGRRQEAQQALSNVHRKLGTS